MKNNNQHIGSWKDLKSIKFEDNILHYSFDFWNTIANSNPVFKSKRTEYLSALLNNKFTYNQINNAFEKIGKEYNNEIERGSETVLPVILYKRVIKELNYINIVEIDSLAEEINALFLQHPPRIEPEFLDYIETIKDCDKTISITSNTAFIAGSVIKSFLVSVELYDNFDFLIFSDELEYGKPSEHIFQNLLNTVQKDKQEISKKRIIHIGDNFTTDYLGASKFGLKAFQIKKTDNFRYPRYAAHNITSKENIPISAEEYSKFKFGDNSIAKKYGVELFNYFISKNVSWIKDKTDTLIIYSSPYTYIPTSSYYLSKAFFDSLNEFIEKKPSIKIKLKWGKINRCQTYTEDYGALNAKERYELIKNDTYEFSEKPDENHKLLFIDDISITGTHQRVIENLMKENNYNNDSIFLYYSMLENLTIDPKIENELNYNYVDSIDKLMNLIYADSFVITTRALKYILKLPETEFDYFLKSLLSRNKFNLLENILTYSNNNGYDKIDMYKINHSTLSRLVLTELTLINI